MSDDLRVSSNVPAPSATAPHPRVTLRILATTDLHGHILPWDDLADRLAPDRGLAQIASLIWPTMWHRRPALPPAARKTTASPSTR